jgi:hypothetical protein
VLGEFLQREWIESLKCAIYRLEDEKDLRKDVEGLLYRTLESIGNKELKVVR